MEYPELTKEQQKRFRLFMVKCRFVGSEAEARKMTPHKKAFNEVFLKMMEHVCAAYGSREVEYLNKQIEDICQLYAVDDLSIPEPVDNVDSKEVVKRVRGEGKKPKKSTLMVRFEPIQLERLKQLGGNVSNHIRAAVDSYLDSKRIDEKPESVDDG